MMLKTNGIMTRPKQAGNNMDFVMHELKNMGRVDIKLATPYTVYLGKIRVKGNENPLRVEMLQDRLSF
jgi:hypothetical protein